MQKPQQRKRRKKRRISLTDMWVAGMISTDEYARRKKELERGWQKKS